MNRAGANTVVCRVAAALMLSTAPFVAIERAGAACTPAAPVNNVSVDCTGTTEDQNPPNGYGTGTETGVTINVHPGAKVGGSLNAIFVATGTVTSAGFVQGGIKAAGDVTVSNSIGDMAGGAFDGLIAGGSFGIDAANANVINSGRIAAGVVPGLGTAIHATGTATVSNTGNGINTGIISAGVFGIDAGTVIVTANTGRIEAFAANGVAINAANNANVTNNGGLIQATGANSTAIKAAGDATVTNTFNGTSIGQITGVLFGIDATNANVTNNGVIVSGNGTAIHATGTATVSNTGDGINTGVIGAAAAGITAGTVNVSTNTGLIFANGDGFDAINATIGSANITSNSGIIQSFGLNSAAIRAATNATVDNNTGTIQATEPGGIAINAGGTATVNNSGPGTIIGNASAINAQTVNVTGNSGTIEATADFTGSSGFAIHSNVVTVTNSGMIRENGIAGRAIDGDIQATVNNLAGGFIIADGVNGVAISGSTANVTNAGTVSAGGVAVRSTMSATVNNLSGGLIAGSAFGIAAGALDVTNAAGAIISGGTSGIGGSGTVRNAGTITGGAASVSFNGAGPNTLILQTGSVLNGDAVGSTAAGATNNLVLQGSGTASNNFQNFNTLDVQAGGTWVWNASGSIGATTVSSGTLAVDGQLFSPVSVSSGGVLAGRGTVDGAVSVAGTIAPGAAAPFSTLTVHGNVDFASGSIYRVNINAPGQSDKLQLVNGAAANLTGGTVNVLAQNGFALSTPYTILTAAGGLGGTRFSGVSSSLASAFFTPSLSYDANDVFLTLVAGNGSGTIGFANVALTRNQRAVANALEASPLTNPLVLVVLGQSAAGARQAYDALSGEVFGSLHSAQVETAQFARSAMLGRLRQASYAGAAGELGALGFAGPQLAYAAADANGFPAKSAPGASDRPRDLTFWAQGLGGWGRTDSDGNAASLTSRFGGFLSGVDARFGDTLRAGLVAGYVRSDVNAAARASSAGIDSVQLGAYAGGRVGAFNVRGGASVSYDSIDTSRAIFFPGFTDKASTRFHGNVGQVFGEVGYGMAFGQVAVEPLAGLAYVHLRDGAFLERGGVAALSGSSANENIGYSFLGARAATAVPLPNGTVLVPRAMLQWQHAFGDVTPGTALAFQGTGTGFSVAGVPIARDTALVEGGFDWRFSPQARLGAFYQGELAAHAQTHAVKGTFTWGF
jgi:outer membrane autotransporter protein